MWVRSLSGEDPLENSMETDSSILSWRILWTNEPVGLQSMETQRVRHNWANNTSFELSSVQFSHLVVSDSLWSHGLQHVSLQCPSLTLGAWSNSCPLSQWCHPTISSSVVPFSSCLPPFPASGSFSMSRFFASGGQSIGVSASVSVLPMNIHDWFPLGWIGWISLQSKRLSRVFSNVTFWINKRLLF